MSLLCSKTSSTFPFYSEQTPKFYKRPWRKLYMLCPALLYLVNSHFISLTDLLVCPRHASKLPAAPRTGKHTPASQLCTDSAWMIFPDTYTAQPFTQRTSSQVFTGHPICKFKWSPIPYAILSSYFTSPL